MPLIFVVVIVMFASVSPTSTNIISYILLFFTLEIQYVNEF